MGKAKVPEAGITIVSPFKETARPVPIRPLTSALTVTGVGVAIEVGGVLSLWLEPPPHADRRALEMISSVALTLRNSLFIVFLVSVN
ncbi:hypothetical protein R50072_03380 [Simiduia litorea]